MAFAYQPAQLLHRLPSIGFTLIFQQPFVCLLRSFIKLEQRRLGNRIMPEAHTRAQCQRLRPLPSVAPRWKLPSEAGS